MNKFICTNDTLTIVFSERTLKYKTPDNIGDVLRMLIAKQFKKAIGAIDNTRFLIEEISNGVIKANNGKEYTINNETVPENVKLLINRFIDEKKPVDGIINMWERLKRMPNDVSLEDKKISRESFFDYLVNSCVKILENGCFIAYKGVRSDYRDVHSGTFDNHPGCIPKMKRSDCTVDRNQTCSSGLHVGAFTYMKKHYNNGNRWVECMVDPANVVSVPRDYDCKKIRTCEYKVIRDVTEILTEDNLKFESVLYDGYVEPIEESSILKELKGFKDDSPVEVEKPKKNKKVTNVAPKETTSQQIKKAAVIQKETKKKTIKKGNEKYTLIKTFQVKRISEGRLPITKSILSELGFVPGEKIGIFVKPKLLILDKPTKLCDFELKVVSDGSVRLSKSIVDKIKTDALVFKVQIQKVSSKKSVITIKTF